MEVPLVGSDSVRWTQLKVPSQPDAVEPCCPSLSGDLAGSFSQNTPSFRQVVWRVHKSIPKMLELMELRESNAQETGLQLLFEEPLSPFVAVYSDQVHCKEETLCVCVITVSGAVCVAKISSFDKYKNASALAKLEVVQLSLASELLQLDQITAYAAVAGILCIGGKSGSIVCCSIEQINREGRGAFYELKDGDPRLGRLWGLVARVKTVGSLQCLSIQLIQGRSTIFALHEDGTFRIWDLCDRRRLLNFNLYRGDLAGCAPKMMWVQEHGLRSGSRQIAFLFRNMLGAAKDTIHIYDLNFDRMDGGLGQVSITYQLNVPNCQGTVLDLKLLADSFWKLEEVGDGQFCLIHSSTKREEAPVFFRLLESELENELFHRHGDDWEDIILFQQSTRINSKIELVFPVSELFLSRILQPGVFQQHLLRKVLEKNKRKIPELDFLMFTKDGIQKEILAALESESTGKDDWEYMYKWKAFYSDYLSLWKQTNIPYAMLLDLSTGSVGLIRRQSLSIVRSFSEFEKLHRDNDEGKQTIDWSTLKTALVPNRSEEDILALLLKCTQTISKQLGRIPLSIFSQALFGDKHVLLSHLSSVFMRLLDVGYDLSAFTSGTSHMGVDTAREKKLEYRQEQRKFELHMLLLLQHLRDSIGSWSEVLDVVRNYANGIVEDMRSSVSKTISEGPEYGAISTRLVLKATAQVSWIHFEASRDLFLLLGYILTVKGQVGVPPNEVSRIQGELMLEVRRALLMSVMVHWLTVSFADFTLPEDFSLQLSSLQINGVSAEKTQNRQPGNREITLAEILISAFPHKSVKGLFTNSKGLISADALLFNVKAFTSWLIWGDSIDQQPPICSQFLALSIALLRHGQYRALEDFLNIVEGLCSQVQAVDKMKSRSGDWCACQHLMGCSLLGQGRANYTGSSKEKKIGDAICCFFRVASAMEQERDPLWTVLVETGMQTTLPVDGSASAWKLQYYEWVMQIFEQNNVSRGACQFAHAALGEVDEAVKCLNSTTPETSNGNSISTVLKGRLWANIFKFSLDLKRFREAYCAITSNPDGESKYICLRRFLIVLCEQKSTEVLCGSELPYVGMLERVEEELLLKAEYSGIGANPNPYKLLYSFHMHRSNWRRAALYMYLYAIRMKDAGLSKAQLPATFVLQEQLHCLAAAINALQLVKSAYAWLDIDSDIVNRSSSKRLRVHVNNDAGHGEQKRRSKLIDLEELGKYYTLTLALLLLVESNVKLNLQGHKDDLSPTEVLSLLVRSGLYEMAFSILFQFWKDSSLISELEQMFRIMTERCCLPMHTTQLYLEESLTRALPDSKKQLGMVASFCEHDGSCKAVDNYIDGTIAGDDASDATWNSLQEYLEKYAKQYSRLPIVVAETMLSIDRLMELPVWLVDMFKGGRHAGPEGMGKHGADPAALLRIYLDFGRLSEATMLVVDYMKAWSNMRPVDVIKRKRMCAVWFPYTLVDRLKFQLAEIKGSDQYGTLVNLLGAPLQRHLKQLEIDSNDVASLVHA